MLEKNHSSTIALLTRCLMMAGLLLCLGCGASDVDKLALQLSDEDASVRKDAAKQLESMGVLAAPAAEELTTCLSDADSRVRYRAAKALSKIGRASEVAVEELGQILVDEKDQQTRYYAAKALDQCPEACEPIIEDLMQGLNDEHPKVRYYCIKVLGKLGPDARIALNHISNLRTDRDESVRKAAESAIGRIDK